MLRALQLTHPGIVEFFASIAATATHEALMAGLFKVLGRTAQLLVQTDPFHVLYPAGAARDAWFHAAGANFTIARMCVLARSMWRYAQGA